MPCSAGYANTIVDSQVPSTLPGGDSITGAETNEMSSEIRSQIRLFELSRKASNAAFVKVRRFQTLADQRAHLEL